MSSADYSNYKVLIIDDVASLRELLIHTMQTIGFKQIEQAENGIDALKKCRLQKEEPFDLIMCDINMPEMDGIDFVTNIREVKEYTTKPIIMVSTESEVNIILEAISKGANDYVLKPAEKEILEKKIAKLMER